MIGVWVNSIGMRSPALNLADARRLLGKTLDIASAARREAAPGLPERLEVHSLPMLPWHGWGGVVHTYNRHTVRRFVTEHASPDMAVVTANPLLIRYLDWYSGPLVYLKLDAYADLPGVDGQLVNICEPVISCRADLVAATAPALLRGQRDDALLLPQGVDHSHFASRVPKLDGPKTLGFFGLIAEWLDFDLVAQVAAANPDWVFEFVGPSRTWPTTLEHVPNVKRLPAQPYADLPRAISHWHAAWIPFLVNDLTQGVHPLKAFEYLAAGLPTYTTALPAIADHPEIIQVSGASGMNAALQEYQDSHADRLRRTASVKAESWTQRAQVLRTSTQTTQRVQNSAAASA